MSAEIEKQRTYIGQVLTFTYSRIWSKFPLELQPEMDVIAPRITIETIKNDEQLRIHPDIQCSWFELHALPAH